MLRFPLEVLLVDLREVLLLRLLLHEGFDDPDTGDILLGFFP